MAKQTKYFTRRYCSIELCFHIQNTNSVANSCFCMEYIPSMVLVMTLAILCALCLTSGSSRKFINSPHVPPLPFLHSVSVVSAWTWKCCILLWRNNCTGMNNLASDIPQLIEMPLWCKKPLNIVRYFDGASVLPVVKGFLGCFKKSPNIKMYSNSLQNILKSSNLLCSKTDSLCNILHTDQKKQLTTT